MEKSLIVAQLACNVYREKKKMYVTVYWKQWWESREKQRIHTTGA